MPIVLVANTPHSAALIIPAIAKLFPDAGPVITIAATRTDFSFPEKTRYRDFPMIRNVEREPFVVDYGFAPRRKTTPISIDEAIEEISQASTVFLFNPGADGFRSHYHAELMVRSRNTVAPIRIIEDHPLTTSLTVRAIETSALIDDFRPALDAVAIEEYFDFNFRLNSYPLVATLIEKSGVKTRFNISAGGLQMLLWLRSREKGKGGRSFTVKELELKAKLWTGSDEFPRIDQFGRRISLRNSSRYDNPGYSHYDDPGYELRNMRLLTDDEERLELTQAGREVADAFPSVCSDADLPFRIEAWKRLTVEQAMGEINAYLMSFFGFHQLVTRDKSAEEFFSKRGF
jgi:hypothetical protein